MYTLKSAHQNYKIEEREGKLYLNDGLIDLDISDLGNQHFHVIEKHKSFEAELLELNKEEKYVLIKVNAQVYRFDVSDQYDILLKEMGLDKLNQHTVKELKAPMPGLVLQVMVQVGDEIKKGDNLLVLEAMKMENILKAPADATVKSILIKAGDKVEKNQVLIQFA
ncbi:acetyl-CoA carboxylase biotin carboxyl carrier protein subunit [Pedobacter puniceum]|uniref:Biotin/lipoyl-binding protein n=1 Tax=Pedobacter puniceum TaxID=2666136 RepID=A0A7K0FP57_9SPHI|nr:acetyl-CoA carboxylase biotin carboxyl carrier protein subunit [Pedobacter puniceum]MRX47421.1 biotin/lipoyl-binding protein [Pedobacter puniceum]